MAPSPDGRPGRPDRYQVPSQADLEAKFGGLGSPGQEGVGGQVHPPPGELGRPELAPDVGAGLEHMDGGR
jgi:hypothetical protein